MFLLINEDRYHPLSRILAYSESITRLISCFESQTSLLLRSIYVKNNSIHLDIIH